MMDLKFIDSHVEHVLAGTEKKNPVASFRGNLDHMFHQVGPVYPTRKRSSQQVRGPYYRHTISKQKVGTIDCLLQTGVSFIAHNLGSVYEGYVGRQTIFNAATDFFFRLTEGQSVHGAA